jgi:hypothetical protein
MTLGFCVRVVSQTCCEHRCLRATAKSLVQGFRVQEDEAILIPTANIKPWWSGLPDPAKRSLF